MKYMISSIIESKLEGFEMDDNSPNDVYVDTDGDLVHESKSDSYDSKSNNRIYHHKSEARSDKQGFFHTVKLRHKGINQTTNVSVNVQPSQEDPITGCFKNFFKCMK